MLDKYNYNYLKKHNMSIDEMIKSLEEVRDRKVRELVSQGEDQAKAARKVGNAPIKVMEGGYLSNIYIDEECWKDEIIDKWGHTNLILLVGVSDF